MRKKKEILEEIEKKGRLDWIQVELLLDIRELLQKHGKDK